MIGYWHHPVVRLSVCDLCIVALRVGVHHTAKTLHQRVPSRHVPICPFRHFCVRMYRLATKCTRKKRSEKRLKCLWTEATRMYRSRKGTARLSTRTHSVPCREARTVQVQQRRVDCGRVHLQTHIPVSRPN